MRKKYIFEAYKSAVGDFSLFWRSAFSIKFGENLIWRFIRSAKISSFTVYCVYRRIRASKISKFKKVQACPPFALSAKLYVVVLMFLTRPESVGWLSFFDRFFSHKNNKATNILLIRLIVGDFIIYGSSSNINECFINS